MSACRSNAVGSVLPWCCGILAPGTWMGAVNVSLRKQWTGSEKLDATHCLPPETVGVLHRCLRRIAVWPEPPNYSTWDWKEEVTAHGTAAAWQACCDHDPASRIPLAAFVYQRVMSSVRTRYRQEWTYALRCAPDEAGGSPAAETLPSQVIHDGLGAALSWLSEVDRWLIEQLFWEGRTESEVAGVLGIGQKSVSKRKQAALAALRRWLNMAEKMQS